MARTNPPGWDQRLAEARKVAQTRASQQAIGPEWPRSEDVDLDAALAELTIEMLSTGLRIAAGANPDGMSIWVRMTMPDDAIDERAGKVAFTASDLLDKALRKAVQLLETQSPKIWKPNAFSPSKLKE